MLKFFIGLLLLGLYALGLATALVAAMGQYEFAAVALVVSLMIVFVYLAAATSDA